MVSSALCYADWPEYQALHFCRTHLSHGDLVFDVGANVGHISLLMSDVVGPENLICFEPTPVSYQRLRENFLLNGWPTESLFPVAVGEESGEVEIFDAPSPITTNRIESHARAGAQVEVQMVPLNEFCNYRPEACVGLLKVDVEGHEAAVFKGAEDFLERRKPKLILFESLDGHLDVEIRGLLETHAYVAFQLGRDGNPNVARLDAQNLFAAREELLVAHRDAATLKR